VCFNVSFNLTLFGQCVLRVLAIFDGMFQQNCCTFEVGTLKSRYCVLLKFYYLPKYAFRQFEKNVFFSDQKDPHVSKIFQFTFSKQKSTLPIHIYVSWFEPTEAATCK